MDEPNVRYKVALRALLLLRESGLDLALAPTKHGDKDVVLLCLMATLPSGKLLPLPIAEMKPFEWVLECTPLTRRGQYVWAEDALPDDCEEDA